MNDDIFKQLEEDFEENLASVNKVDQGGLKEFSITGSTNTRGRKEHC